jgi:NAD(P)H-hydrate epimerase
MSLPPYLDPLYTAEEMRAADRFAIADRGVHSLALMERAGAGLAGAVARVAPNGAVRVVIGGGHNGADGLVAAQVLRAQGREVDVLAVVGLDQLRGDPQIALERLQGPPPVPFTSSGLVGSAVVVDAMLGTGFEGVPLEPVAGAIAALNASPAPTVAADVPSGLNASTGEVEGSVVQATATATNHAPKIGLHVGAGAALAGGVEVVDIGIPPGGPAVATAGLITARARDAASEDTSPAAGAAPVVVSAAELGHRLGMEEKEVERRPLRCVRSAADLAAGVVVLLVARPLVAAPHRAVAVGAQPAPPGLRARVDALLEDGSAPFVAAVAALAG